MTDFSRSRHAAVYREPYPTWILVGMDVLAAGILLASFRDAWSVVCALGGEHTGWGHWIVAGAVVLAIDASILLLEQARSQVKLRGGGTLLNDIWVLALIMISAVLNVRYLTQSGTLTDQWIGALLGMAIPTTIAVLGYVKGDMLAYNARYRMLAGLPGGLPDEDQLPVIAHPADRAAEGRGTPAPLFRLRQ